MSLLLQTPRARLRRAAGPLVRALTGTGPPSPLAGRTVLVTGASSGIGEATARAVARRGAHVVVVARRAERLERLVAEISEQAAEPDRSDSDRSDDDRSDDDRAGGRATAYACDLTDAASVDDLVARVLAEVGPVDYLVNNAGRSIRRSLHLTHDRLHDFERTMAVNYFAPVRLTMGLLPSMRAQGFGHVVNLGTWGVQLKAPKFSAYIASKTALDTWSRIASREAYGDGVTFTNMRVSLVRTEMVAPTEAYSGHGATPAQAAERVVRALEDRPVTANTLVGSLGEVANLAAPRATDLFWHLAHRRSPDSAAARGVVGRERAG